MNKVQQLIKLADSFQEKTKDETIAAVRGIENTTPQFRKKLFEIAKNLKTNPDWIAAVISNESGFDPKAVNGFNPKTGAVGLIQFMPATATSLLGITRNQKTTASEWRKTLLDSRQKFLNMDAMSQLDYVYKFYSQFAGRLSSAEDVYMAVFYPAGVGKSADYVIAEKGSTIYEKNPAFDKAGTGSITKGKVGGSIRSAINAAGGKRISINDATIYGVGGAKKTNVLDKHISDNKATQNVKANKAALSPNIKKQKT